MLPAGCTEQMLGLRVGARYFLFQNKISNETVEIVTQ